MIVIVYVSFIKRVSIPIIFPLISVFPDFEFQYSGSQYFSLIEINYFKLFNFSSTAIKNLLISMGLVM